MLVALNDASVGGPPTKVQFQAVYCLVDILIKCYLLWLSRFVSLNLLHSRSNCLYLLEKCHETLKINSVRTDYLQMIISLRKSVETHVKASKFKCSLFDCQQLWFEKSAK